MVNKVTLRNKQLGAALAGMRKRRNLTQIGVAIELELSQSRLSRIESGLRRATADELKCLTRLYELTDDEQNEIRQLRSVPSASADEDAVLDNHFIEFLLLEAEASMVRALFNERLPMNLQAEPYLLVQHHEAGHDIHPGILLADRRDRQAAFLRKNPSPYLVVVTESALMRMPGGRNFLMREQAKYLLEMIDCHPRLDFRILPNNADVPFVDGDMTILDFADGRPSRVFIPYGNSAALLQGSEVGWRVRHWSRLHEAALNPTDTQKILEALVDGHGERLPGLVSLLSI